jgi:hypothetical protein
MALVSVDFAPKRGTFPHVGGMVVRNSPARFQVITTNPMPSSQSRSPRDIGPLYDPGPHRKMVGRLPALIVWVA